LIKRIRHTGLVVRDLERSLVFYQTLGFRLWKREVETGPFIDTVVGMGGVRLEWAKLHAPDGSMVELLQYHSHPDRRSLKNAPSNRLGCSHIAFTVDDVLAMCTLIDHLGGSTVNMPVESPSGKQRVAYCHDPDGILMELVEDLDGPASSS